MKRPIVIVGMQRSGTSAVSGALKKLGLSFGNEELLYPADSNNPQGFFEHRKVTILNLRCLSEFEMHPTTLDTLPADWKEHPQAASLRDELKAFLADEFSDAEKWGIKQPLTSLVLPLYRDVFEELGIEPHFVLCVRNPIEVMQSEAKLDFGQSYRVMPSLGKMAMGSWLRYTLGSFADAQGATVTVVGYDRLLANPREELEAIVNRHSDWCPSEEAWQAAVGSIKTDLRHNRVSTEELDAYPLLVREAYAAALEFKDYNAAWRKISLLHAEFAAWTQILGEPAPGAGKLGLAWLSNGQRSIAEARYVPTSKWQTVSLRVDAPSRMAVSGLIYGLPCRVWLRRCVWRSPNGETPAVLRCGLGSKLSLVEGIQRLDAVFEPEQIRFVTPDSAGPFDLELEFLLEVGPQISADASARVSRQLDDCVTAVDALTR